MKKSLALIMLLAAVLIFTGCGKGQEDMIGQTEEKKVKKSETADNGIIVPENASKECKKEYTEKTGGKYANCADYGTETVCVYYKKKSAGTNHFLEQVNECQACMNWGRSEILDENLEFLGMVKGKCPQGIYKK